MRSRALSLSVLCLLLASCEARSQTPPASARPAETAHTSTRAGGGEAKSAAKPGATKTAKKTPFGGGVRPATGPTTARAARPAPPTSMTMGAFRKKYTWLRYQNEWKKVDAQDTTKLIGLHERFKTPEGFTRVSAPKGSFQAYLRTLPLRTDRDDVRLYTGKPVSMPSAGIIPFDLGRRDVHQCADSVIRMHAEYAWHEGKAKKLAKYHYTSGHLASWSDWASGKQLVVRGNSVKKVSRRPVRGYRAYRRYQERVFTYASTRSLHRDGKRVRDMKQLKAGDFFLTSGSPGHVVILLDVAEHPDGRRVALVGQGYLPARDVHVIRGSARHTVDGVWFLLPDGDQRKHLTTPTWSPFSMRGVWRFRQ